MVKIDVGFTQSLKFQVFTDKGKAIYIVIERAPSLIQKHHLHEYFLCVQRGKLTHVADYMDQICINAYLMRNIFEIQKVSMIKYDLSSPD